MYSSKQQAINHYKDLMNNETVSTYNTVDPVVWINPSQINQVLRDHPFSLDQEPLKMPPMVEANWDTNDTKEFDRLLNKILFEEKDSNQYH